MQINASFPEYRGQKDISTVYGPNRPYTDVSLRTDQVSKEHKKNKTTHTAPETLNTPHIFTASIPCNGG